MNTQQVRRKFGFFFFLGGGGGGLCQGFYEDISEEWMAIFKKSTKHIFEPFTGFGFWSLVQSKDSKKTEKFCAMNGKLYSC